MQIKTDCTQYTQEDGLTPGWMDLILEWDPGMTKSFEFCQNSQDDLTPPNCCFTGFLSGHKQRCKEIQYEAHELGSCGKFKFDFDSVESIKMLHITLHGHVGAYHSAYRYVEKGRPEFKKEGQREFNASYAERMLKVARDAWTPEWVKLVLGNVRSQKSKLNISGAVIKCSLDGRIDGNDKNEPTFMNFHCKPEGKFLHHGLGNCFFPFINNILNEGRRINFLCFLLIKFCDCDLL